MNVFQFKELFFNVYNEIDRKIRALAIQNSFDKAPDECPECSSLMIQETIFLFLPAGK